MIDPSLIESLGFRAMCKDAINAIEAVEIRKNRGKIPSMGSERQGMSATKLIKKTKTGGSYKMNWVNFGYDLQMWRTLQQISTIFSFLKV